MPKSVESSLRVAELFAGVGGFRLGLERAGHKVIFSNQWEPSTKKQHASSVYQANFGEEFHTCIDVALLDCLPDDVDLLVGGFPCQDYSVAKSASASNGIEGKKGVLWWEILRLTKQARPKYIFLENVDRLLKSPAFQRGRDFAIMLKTLGDEGYVVEWRVVNAAEYGFPQRRKRIFIFASRIEEVPEEDAEQLIIGGGVLAKAFPGHLTSNFQRARIDVDLVKVSNGFNKDGGKSPFFPCGFYANGLAITSTYDPEFQGQSQNLGDVLLDIEQVDSSFHVDKARLQEWEYLKGAKQVERRHKDSGFAYKYSEGKMAFPDSLTAPSRTILTAEGGSSPSRFKHIVQQNGIFRRLTPVELERLNGFPDDWTKFDATGTILPDTRRAFLMGNALVVGLIERVGKVLGQIND